MGKQPAVVIIARHGARLDQANKQWHLTSPTPYDPPLTYAGWTQAKSLGTRIAGIINQRETESDDQHLEQCDGNRRKRKRQHKIIIHSSPFLRCIQTSIGISAGMATSEPKAALFAGSAAGSIPAKTNDITAGHIPTTIRVDACLGEWLTPDYFEGITPPPDSVLMVAGAKADLLRASDEIRGADLSGTSPYSAVEYAKEFHRRGPSFGNAKIRGMSTLQQDQPAYISPLPKYAISSSDPIPAGYVAHARDACVEVDYRWDSMRSPQNWGDGGELGEEWSGMHRRFRNTIQSMLAWYENEPNEEVDIVLVIVTHGAGSNALIGAMTAQPVLLDVGLASLTMAVRTEEDVPRPSPVSTRRGSLDLGISTRYHMQIIASTEHLRAPSNTMGLNSPRLGRSPAFASRKIVGADSLEGFTLGDPMNMRSNSYMAVGSSADQNLAPINTSGLWNSNGANETGDSWPAFDRVLPIKEFEEEKFPRHMPVRNNTQNGLWGSTPDSDLAPKRRWTLIEQ